MIRRWRQVRQAMQVLAGDPKQILIQDIDNAQTVMAMVLYSARAMGAPDTQDPATSIAIWRAWSTKVRDWAEQ